MARVYYTGWEDREPARGEHGIVTAGGPMMQKRVTVEGQSYVFRGQTGKRSQARVVDDSDQIAWFQEHDDFEVEP